MVSSGEAISLLGLRLFRAQGNAIAIKAPSRTHPIPSPAELPFERPLEVIGGDVEVDDGVVFEKGEDVV